MIIKAAAMNINNSINNELDLDWRLSNENKGKSDELQSFIKKLFETLFGVNVIGINTHRPPRKKVRAGLSNGYRPAYKRVILTLKEGQSIQF